jgi:hypothetical protein
MKLKIGPHTYTVYFDKNMINQVNTDAGEAHYGVTDIKHLKITIDPSQAHTQLQDTLLHEILHAIFDITAAQEDIDHKTEEKLIRRIAPILLQTIQQNPHLINKLTKQ